MKNYKAYYFVLAIFLLIMAGLFITNSDYFKLQSYGLKLVGYFVWVILFPGFWFFVERLSEKVDAEEANNTTMDDDSILRQKMEKLRSIFPIFIIMGAAIGLWIWYVLKFRY